MQIEKIVRRKHTTEVTDSDGITSNQFLCNWLYVDRDGERRVSSYGTFTDWQGFLTTLARSLQLLAERGEEIVYMDATCVHTKTGGVSIGFVMEPGLEEAIARGRLETEARMAALRERMRRFETNVSAC